MDCRLIFHSQLSEKRKKKKSLHLVPRNTHKGQSRFLAAGQKEGLAASQKAFQVSPEPPLDRLIHGRGIDSFPEEENIGKVFGFNT